VPHKNRPYFLFYIVQYKALNQNLLQTAFSGGFKWGRGAVWHPRDDPYLAVMAYSCETYELHNLK